MKKKILSILLTAAMLLTAQGIPVMAGSVTGGIEEVESTGAASPANPVHHCTKQSGGSDYTDWSYVYFGSYPQTEVTGNDLTTAITGASYDANGDAWVNGTKYRRASRSDANRTSYFGDSEYRYFKWEKIKWRVLENNGSTLFVVSDQGLDCKVYNETRASITWENCTLRTWLNDIFYNTAFSDSEQKAIIQQTVVNNDNPDYRTEGGNDTQDKVYLLSIGEVENSHYGFCESDRTYSISRWMKTSSYAHAMGVTVYSNNNTGENTYGSFWVRSPGYITSYAAVVNHDGQVARYGSMVDGNDGAVAPALHINLSSELWSLADDEINANATQPNPKETTLKGKLKAAKKAITVKWKKQADVSGYQIQYSTNKKFMQKATKIKTVKKPATTKTTIKKLKSGKKYYVRIRTYKTVNGTNYYSNWSKTKKIKTK